MDALLESAPAGLLSFTDDGVLVAVNEEAATLLGHARSAMVGQPMKGYLPVADRIFFHTYLLPVLLLRGRADEISLSLRANDGSYLPVLLNARRDESRGRPLNSCVFLAMHRRHLFESEMLTAKRAAEEAARAEREAVERMKQVQAQLALSERLASVGTLAAGAAHEIANPLAYITVNLELRAPRGVIEAISGPPEFA